MPVVISVPIDISPLSLQASEISVDHRLTKNVEDYLKGIKFISAKFEQLSSSGEIYEGKFWLSKQKNLKVKIDYTKGIFQEILIENGIIQTLDKNTSKIYKNSISQTPIYSILMGTLNLSKENFEIEENTKDILRLKINKSTSLGGMSVMLAFSKYPNGNLKNIEAWVIDDGKNETLFSFDKESLRVNDPNSVNDKVFTLSRKS